MTQKSKNPSKNDNIMPFLLKPAVCRGRKILQLINFLICDKNHNTDSREFWNFGVKRQKLPWGQNFKTTQKLKLKNSRTFKFGKSGKVSRGWKTILPSWEAQDVGTIKSSSSFINRTTIWVKNWTFSEVKLNFYSFFLQIQQLEFA